MAFSRRRNVAALIFPPTMMTETPPISLAALTAYLRRHEVHVRPADLNQQFHRYLMDSVIIDHLQGESQPVTQEALHFIKDFFLTSLSRGYLENLDVASWPKTVTCGPQVEKISAWHPSRPFSYHQFLKNPFASSETFLSFLDSEGHNVYHGFYNVIDSVFDDAVFAGFSIIGFSQVVPAMTIARLLRKNRPEIHIGWGGPWITNYIYPLIKFLEQNPEFASSFDYLLVKEGERPLLELIMALSSGREIINAPPNMYVRIDGENRYSSSRDMNWSADLNDLPTPDYSDYDLNQYFSFQGNKGSLVVQASRSCSYRKCAFCNAHTNFGTNAYRIRAIEKVIADLDELSAKFPQVRVFDFADAIISPDRLLKICSYFNKKRGPALNWEIDTRMENALSLDVISGMKTSQGLLRFGLETVNARLIQLMGKNNRREDMERLLDLCAAMNYSPFFMTIIGLPSETEDEADELVDFLVSLAGRVTYQIADFMLERNSPIFCNPSKYGICLASDAGYSFQRIPFTRIAGYGNDRASAIYHHAVSTAMRANCAPRNMDSLASLENWHIFKLKLKLTSVTFDKYHLAYNGFDFDTVIAEGYKFTQEQTSISGKGMLKELPEPYFNAMKFAAPGKPHF